MLTTTRPVIKALAAVLATAMLGVPTALSAPAALAATPAIATPRAEEPPPNERAPRVPDAPDLGDAPWTSPEARDMVGYRLSTYTGKYYDRRFEQYRLCVVQRESGGQYGTVSGIYNGAYQFGTGWTPPSYLVDRIRPEMEKSYGAPVGRLLDELARTPVSKWSRFWQDAAFWTVFDLGRGWEQWKVYRPSQYSWVCDHTAGAERGWPDPNRSNYSPLERDKAPRPSTSSDMATKASTSRATPSNNQQLARDFIRERYGWRYAEFKALKSMWWRESNWRHDVVNNHPNGPWYGLGQVNGGFISSRGYSIKEYMASPLAQIKVGAAYIKERYGSPVKAWAAWIQRYNQNGAGWY